MGPLDLPNRFKSHPVGPDGQADLQEIRDKCYELAKRIVELVPDGREQSLAITYLEQVMFFANAGISRPLPVQSAVPR